MVGRSPGEFVPPCKIRNKSVRERFGGSADRYSPLLSAWQRTARRAARPDARGATWRVFGLDGAQRLGKTTLLNLIAGLDKPSRGEVWVGSDRISDYTESKLTPWRTRNIGFIFQFYHLLPVLTAYENVELPLLLLSLSSRER